MKPKRTRNPSPPSHIRAPGIPIRALDNPVLLNFWLFICGTLTSLDVQLIGRITIAEILVFLSIPALLLARKIEFWNTNFIKCTAVLALMILATLVADQFNGFIFELSARAIARPIFIFGFLVFFVLVLERAPRSLLWFIYGLLVAGIINYFRPSEFEAIGTDDSSTYGGFVFRVEPLIYALVLAGATLTWLRVRLITLAVVAFAVGSLIYFGSSRSSLLVYLISLTLFSTLIVINPRNLPRFSLSRNRLIALISSALAAITAAYLGYITLAPAGMLGETQRQKFEDQSTTILGASPLGLVLAGRPQVFGAILGIMDRPIIGFGSWRHDLTSVYVMDAITDVGTDPTLLDSMAQKGMAPGAGHSVLFQAWVENGITVALCWCFIAGIVIKVSLVNIKHNNIYTAFFIFSFTAFFWTFFFSPPPVFLRYLVGIYLAYYVVFMDKKRPLRNVAEIC